MKFNQELEHHIESFRSCRPPLWAGGGHAQTIMGFLFSNPQKKSTWQLKKIPTTGNDHLVAFYQKGKSDKIIVLFHGLSGSSDSSYMIRLANQFLETGDHVLLVNHRGAHPDFRQANEIYHSGRSEDVSAVIGWTRAEFPGLRVIAMGFSMSANILLLNLAGIKSDHQADFTFCLNGPICLADAAERMEVGFSQVYGWHFTWELSRQRQVKTSSFSIKKFDDQFTAPRAGYKNGQEYYAMCSAKNYVDKINSSAVVVTAADDPFVATEFYRNVKWPSSIKVRIENFGGHLGYLDQQSVASPVKHWMDEFLVGAVKLLR